MSALPQPNESQANSKKFHMNWDPVIAIWNGVQNYAKTFIVLAFIINSVALALYGFGLIDLNRPTASVLGAIAAAYGAIVLFNFVHNGVKSSVNNKRKR